MIFQLASNTFISEPPPVIVIEQSPIVTEQVGPVGVPAHPQPSLVTISFVVLESPSLQEDPGVAGKPGLFGWQSWLLQMPSPSESPP